MRFLDPNEAIRQFGVYGAQDVADFGCGSGHFALCAAKRLDGGRLFAVDVEKEMLERLQSEAKHHGHKNIHTLWGDVGRLGGVPLGDQSLDKIIASNILFQVDDRDAFIQEVKRLLRRGGKVLLIDWHEGENFGPHKHHKISKDSAHKFFERHGFIKEQDIDAGDYHYGMILRRE